MFTKALVVFALVVCVASAQAVDARPKRSVLVAAAPVAVASVPVAQVSSAVVHHHPTSVVKTEQVRSGDHASYSYSHEVRSEPVVHHHTHAAVAAAPVVATHHTVAAAVPAYHYAAYYPSYAHSYAYSPYSYVIGK